LSFFDDDLTVPAMQVTAPAKRSRPPIWLMGFCNLPSGIGAAVALTTTPQLLAARGVPEADVANVTSAMLVSIFTCFLFAPILDWRFSRRAYAIALALLSAVLCFAALLCMNDLLVLALLLLGLGWAFNLNNAAVGGWFSGLASQDEKGRLGAWLTVGNLAGVGVGAATAILAIRHLPPVVGPAVVSLLFLAPVPLYLMIPATPADSTLAHESFARFARDVVALFRKPDVRWLLFFLVMPAASFALSNTVTGLGRDFGASEAFVGAICGLGVALAGIIGSLAVPPLARRLPVERLYLMVGAVGAAFSLMLVWLPRTPASYAIAVMGQNAFWAASYSAIAIIVLRSNGERNPLAATQFGLLSAAAGVPLTYMQFIDGHAYTLGRLTGSYVADAALSLGACAILALLSWRRGARDTVRSAVALVEE
jgi:PAT family beta-lactamase induction signal transducer AmpG